MNKGFTLLELLVSIVISSILIGISFTYYFNVYKRLHEIRIKQDNLSKEWLIKRQNQMNYKRADEVINSAQFLILVNKLTQHRDTIPRN